MEDGPLVFVERLEKETSCDINDDFVSFYCGSSESCIVFVFIKILILNHSRMQFFFHICKPCFYG